MTVQINSTDTAEEIEAKLRAVGSLIAAVRLAQHRAGWDACVAHAREGYVPASLAPEWHAELETARMEGIAAERERIERDIHTADHGYLCVNRELSDSNQWEECCFDAHEATLAAVLAIVRGETP